MSTITMNAITRVPLEEWARNNPGNLKPNSRQLEILANETQFTRKQIRDYFVRQRKALGITAAQLARSSNPVNPQLAPFTPPVAPQNMNQLLPAQQNVQTPASSTSTMYNPVPQNSFVNEPTSFGQYGMPSQPVSNCLQSQSVNPTSEEFLNTGYQTPQYEHQNYETMTMQQPYFKNGLDMPQLYQGQTCNEPCCYQPQLCQPVHSSYYPDSSTMQNTMSANLTEHQTVNSNSTFNSDYQTVPVTDPLPQQINYPTMNTESGGYQQILDNCFIDSPPDVESTVYNTPYPQPIVNHEGSQEIFDPSLGQDEEKVKNNGDYYTMSYDISLQQTINSGSTANTENETVPVTDRLPQQSFYPTMNTDSVSNQLPLNNYVIDSPPDVESTIYNAPYYQPTVNHENSQENFNPFLGKVEENEKYSAHYYETY